MLDAADLSVKTKKQKTSNNSANKFSTTCAIRFGSKKLIPSTIKTITKHIPITWNNVYFFHKSTSDWAIHI